MANTSVNQWLRPAEVAEILGVRATTVSAWARNGRIPFFKTPGGQRLFLRDDIERILTEGTFEPDDNQEAS